MIRVILAGSEGRMGRAVRAEATLSSGVAVVARVDPALSASFETCDADADAVIDFSAPAALDCELAFCAARGLPLVLAVTGHGEDADAKIEAASDRIAILRTANLSYGANALAKLSRQARALLGCAYDVSIVETHHRAKKDAPSGTAKLLAAAMDMPGAPMLSARGGAVVGTHEVCFYGERDVITLKHEALDRSLFAKGALEAAKWIVGCAPGLYGMEDFLGAVRDG